MGALLADLRELTDADWIYRQAFDVYRDASPFPERGFALCFGESLIVRCVADHLSTNGRRGRRFADSTGTVGSPRRDARLCPGLTAEAANRLWRFLYNQGAVGMDFAICTS